LKVDVGGTSWTYSPLAVTKVASTDGSITASTSGGILSFLIKTFEIKTKNKTKR